MGKLSKSDDPGAKPSFAQLPASKHFVAGSWVLMNNRRGEIQDVFTCKCRHADKGLRIVWEDGSVSVVRPWALNRNGLGHP